ncbi:MAG TPA: helix-turn-helix transcriptional regulator [Planctomycetota bacterium]|nr:helix-turn-helix transcriptional regulator [Planctomycetota bacterium]
MDDFAQVPAAAISAFEAVTGLRVSIHDRMKSLWFFLPPERFQHHSPACRAVKLSGNEKACIRFDAEQVHAELAESRTGRVQICHAGLVECVVPVFFNQKLEWILFAGPRLPGAGLTRVRRDQPTPFKKPPWSKELAPRPINDDQAQTVLELLQQLAARLRAWRVEVDAAFARDSGSRHAQGLSSGLSRRAIILEYIYDRHTKPVTLAELARRLHLSESRAGHAVKQACGKSFVALLQEARLRTAAGLLRHTHFSIPEVALRSGFHDLSHFHATFRRAFSCTPLKYRKQTERITRSD